jgi:hypothetical protein
MAEIAAYVQVAIADRTHAAVHHRAVNYGTWRRALASAAREPFLHFIALGALLFGFNQYLLARANFSRIMVTRDDVAGIVTNYQPQYGITPAGTQLESLIDQFVREPTQAELLAYFDAHAMRFQVSGKLTFTQVYFSADTRGEDAARNAAQRLHSKLTGTSTTRAAEQGDPFPSPTDYAALTQEGLDPTVVSPGAIWITATPIAYSCRDRFGHTASRAPKSAGSERRSLGA